ncbi:MAG: hypothetical protein SNF33_00310 (plasmid) [Candidatus Algichlamydia australiensis]|nr:hypothetical protein [Chlamydiales bacterium]
MFEIILTEKAQNQFQKLKKAAGLKTNTKNKKSSKQAGLFKQIKKAINLLSADPRHPGLKTHKYSSIDHPWDKQGKVFEAYAQNNTASAYRIFWCYGPNAKEITIIAIVPHP